MENGINVEGVKPEVVEEIKNGIVAILEIDRDEQTIQVALQAYVDSLRGLPPVHVSNNIIVDKKKKPA